MKSQEQPTLKYLRERANLTQPELSRRMNVGIRIIAEATPALKGRGF
jgi:transcriptional regulator with XRE-family HTH domain